MKYILLIFTCCSVFLFSCGEKENENPKATGSVNFYFTHTVDSQGLSLGEYYYFTDAGNNYKVISLRYMISKLVLYKENGERFDVDMYHYVNAADASTINYLMENIPNGIYTKASFIFGIDSPRNYLGGIPITNQTNSMEWPYGGYHFMQMDGFFKDAGNAQSVYAIHLGGNPYQAQLEFDQIHIEVNSNTSQVGINMNVNGWFNGKHKIDLDADDYSYIMENPAKQLIFKENADAVFSMDASHHH